MQSLEHLNTPKKADIQLTTTQKRTVKYLTPFYKQGAKWFNLLTGKEEKKREPKQKNECRYGKCEHIKIGGK